MQYFPLPKVMNYDSILSVRFSCLGLHGQAVKTSPFHGGNTGSIPVGVIMASWLSWLERRPVTAEVVGSSPIWVVQLRKRLRAIEGVLAQLGEHLPYKQRVIGSSPIGPIYKNADMAQLAEQLICNQQVNGSSPFIGFCQQGNNPASVHGPLAQLVRATGS